MELRDSTVFQILKHCTVPQFKCRLGYIPRNNHPDLPHFPLVSSSVSFIYHSKPKLRNFRSIKDSFRCIEIPPLSHYIMPKVYKKGSWYYFP